MHAAAFDAMSLLMAMAVILVPLVLAGVLLGRPTRDPGGELLASRHPRATGTGPIPAKKR